MSCNVGRLSPTSQGYLLKSIKRGIAKRCRQARYDLLPYGEGFLRLPEIKLERHRKENIILVERLIDSIVLLQHQIEDYEDKGDLITDEDIRGEFEAYLIKQSTTEVCKMLEEMSNKLNDLLDKVTGTSSWDRRYTKMIQALADSQLATSCGSFKEAKPDENVSSSTHENVIPAEENRVQTQPITSVNERKKVKEVRDTTSELRKERKPGFSGNVVRKYVKRSSYKPPERDYRDLKEKLVNLKTKLLNPFRKRLNRSNRRL